MTTPISAIVVLITAPSVEAANQLAQGLLAQKLAACVNIVPAVRSLYIWGGKINDEAEVLLVVKSRANLFNRLESAVKTIHPYDVPEILALPVLMGSADYLAWIEDVTAP
jgi:periplasmic divalent cation tolerance protein